MPDFGELKQRHRAMWASGEYDAVAAGIRPVADHVVRAAGIRAGQRVLDIACGTGNTALMARARGAQVTGVDLTPELLAVARRRAAQDESLYGGIDWKEGDAEYLPCEDASFDVVVSSCGLMFAPDQQKVAREVARVTRRGGRIAIQAWRGDGGVGRMFRLVSEYMPPPPGVPSPLAWSDETHVKSLLGSAFSDFRFEYADCPDCMESPEAMADFFIGKFGPTNRAYHAQTPEKAAAFRRDLIDLYRGYVTPADGMVRFGREYLITVATRS
jgi:SAM-dependent methyltransferase